MNFPLSTSSATGLLLAGVFGLVFGTLLEKGRVTDYNVIVNLFRFRDFTVLKSCSRRSSSAASGLR